MRDYNLREDKSLGVGYWRFQFDCGCEFLTRGGHEVLTMRPWCWMHRDRHFKVFGMDEAGYWVLMYGNSRSMMVADIPVSRGVHPKDYDWNQLHRNLIDAKELAKDAVEMRYRHISALANHLHFLESPEKYPDQKFPGLLKNSRESVERADPDILLEARKVLLMHAARYR